MSTENTTRIAIVTGAASRGIGRGIALRLADVSLYYQDTLLIIICYYTCILSTCSTQDGLDIAVADLAIKNAQLDEVVSEIKAKGRRCISVLGDVSKEEDVKALVNKTVEELGGLDVVSWPMCARSSGYQADYSRW